MTNIRSDSTQVSSGKEVSLLTGLWWWWWWWSPFRAKIITRLFSPAAAAAGGGAIGGAVGGGALATEPCAAGEYNKYKQIQQIRTNEAKNQRRKTFPPEPCAAESQQILGFSF